MEINPQHAIEFIRAHQNYAALLIFVLALGETIIGVSVFIPATLILFALGGILALADAPFWPAWIAGWLGGSLGFSLMYLLSVRFAPVIHTHRWFAKIRPSIEKTQVFFRKWGVAGVVLGHFTGPLRVMVPIAAGLSRMPPVPFMLANLLGALAWISVFFAPGYWLVASPWAHSVWERFGHGG